MKKLFLFFIFTAAAASSIFADNRVSQNVINAFRAARIPVVAEGIPITDFTLPFTTGLNFTLSRQRGKVVFLNFWATWCPPCREEMPSMEALYQRFKDRDFEMIAVNLGETRNQITSFMAQYNLTFPAVIDARQITGSMYGIQAIPATYIIDKRGLIVARQIGSIHWNIPTIIAAIEALLAE